jgi:hypothetical protein
MLAALAEPATAKARPKAKPEAKLKALIEDFIVLPPYAQRFDARTIADYLEGRFLSPEPSGYAATASPHKGAGADREPPPRTGHGPRPARPPPDLRMESRKTA